jgi:hypothetical protein
MIAKDTGLTRSTSGRLLLLLPAALLSYAMALLLLLLLPDIAESKKSPL